MNMRGGDREAEEVARTAMRTEMASGKGDQIADPEKFFAIVLHLSAVRREDYSRLMAALNDIRREFSRGGSSTGVESIAPGTVVNR